jgi:hypothetical protein
MWVSTVHISFPVIAAVLLGPDVQISDTILCRSFITYLSYQDAFRRVHLVNWGQKPFHVICSPVY